MCANLLFGKIFAANCTEMKEIRPGGGASAVPLGSATEKGIMTPGITHITTLHDLTRSSGSIYPTDNAD